jgi:carbon-monoxide dehydrogenase large subunit
VASLDKVKGELTLWGTFQAPHVIRTVASLISGLAEHKIHVIAPDIGGGFGNKVGAYPAMSARSSPRSSPGVPVKWVEDRMENLSTTSFARDYHMTTELAATKDGKIRAARACAGRPWRLRRLRRSVQMAGRVLQHLHRLL